MSRVRPHFKGEKTMQLWIEQQLQKVLTDYADQIEKQKKEKIEKEMFLQRINNLKNHQEGLSGLAGILGSPGAEFSWEDLRNEAMTEKYGQASNHRTCNKLYSFIYVEDYVPVYNL